MNQPHTSARHDQHRRRLINNTPCTQRANRGTGVAVQPQQNSCATDICRGGQWRNSDLTSTEVENPAPDEDGLATAVTLLTESEGGLRIGRAALAAELEWGWVPMRGAGIPEQRTHRSSPLRHR